MSAAWISCGVVAIAVQGITLACEGEGGEEGREVAGAGMCSRGWIELRVGREPGKLRSSVDRFDWLQVRSTVPTR